MSYHAQYNLHTFANKDKYINVEGLIEYARRYEVYCMYYFRVYVKQ